MNFFCRLSKRLLFLLLLVLLVLGVVDNVVAKKNSIKVKVSYKSKNHENLNKKFKLNHPIKISKREIINHLISLKYKGTSMGNEEMGVFFPDEIKKLAPILVKAFAGVDSRKIIHIELKSQRGTTVATTFSFRNYLNWRFESIRGETFFQKNNARMFKIFAWELIPQKGQLYYKSNENKRIHKNWLVAKLNLPVSKIKVNINEELSDLLEKGDSNNKLNQQLENKLKRLKHLYEQDLIDTEEYKTQQKKLFEKLF